MLTVEEALSQILSCVPVMPPERAGLLEALGRVLAEEIHSPRDLPPFDVSQMDGYALRSEDTRAAPIRLAIVGRSVAGRAADRPVAAGECARVMTGAAVPAGADTVVKQEDVEPIDGSLLVKSPIAPGDFIRRRGAEVRTGERVLAAGTLITPPQIALLASLGRSQARVHQRPRVAVLSTGDELREIDQIGSDDRIVDSNTWGACAQILAAGAVPVRLGLAPDDPEAIARALDHAERCDVVLTSAGVSVGERDFVKDVLAQRGVELRFWRVAMKPGKPLAFGMLRRQLFFALPGNPTSAMVSFEQFVRPALLKLAGRSQVSRPCVAATLDGSLHKPAGLVHFVRARTRIEGGLLVAKPVTRQDSGLVSSMAEANSLIVVPAQTERLASGDRVGVQLLDAFEGEAFEQPDASKGHPMGGT